MKIVGTIHAPGQLGMKIRQSIINYCRRHGDGNIRGAILNLRVCGCHTEIGPVPLIRLTTTKGVELSAADLREHIKADQKVLLSGESNVTVSITRGDVA